VHRHDAASNLGALIVNDRGVEAFAYLGTGVTLGSTIDTRRETLATGMILLLAAG
jgi:hypothetical protein